jgi:hypothetical protein
MVALLAALALPGVAGAADFFEDFTTNSDGRWIGNGNRSNPQPGGLGNNYGWSDSDNTGTSPNPPSGQTATGTGEFGGSIQRGNFSDYGYNIGTLLPDQPFHADGVYTWVGGSGNWFVGFYNQAFHMTAGGDPRNFVGIQMDDSRAALYHNARSDHNDRTHNGPAQVVSEDVPVTWSIDYNGAGQTTFTIGSDVNIVLNSGSGYFTGGGGPPTVFNRFGFFPGSTSDSAGQVAFDDITFTLGTIITTPPVWNVDASGDWNASTSWDTGSPPNAVGATARFLGAISAPRTVFANNGVTVGSLEFNNSNTYVLTGAGSLSMDVNSGTAQIGVVQGSHKINLPLFINDNTVADVAGGAILTIADPLTLVGGTSLTKTGAGSMEIISTVTSTAPSLVRTAGGSTTAHLDLGPGMTVEAVAGTTSFNASQHLAGLSISNTGAARLTAGGDKVLVTDSLSITGSGVLDLADNDAIVDYTGSVGSLVNDTRANLAAGRLTSSLGTLNTRLGYGDNAVLGKDNFAGEAVDTSSLLIKFTYAGDTDLDGDVDVGDLGALATAWQSSGVWTAGDFDYNGVVDVNDLGMLATNWQAGVGNPLGASLDDALLALGLPSSAVPEPTSIGLLFVAGFLTGRRARRA